MKDRAKIFKNVIDKYQKVPKTWDGLLGNGLGIVDVAGRRGYVWVRIENQAPIQVFNKRVTSIYNQPVLVGYDPIEPRLFQVLSVKTVVSSRGYGGLQDRNTSSAHHLTHEWMSDNGGTDVVFSQLRQIMPMRPSPGISGISIDIYRAAPAWFGDKWARVSGQSVNLSPYVPITGARYVLLYADNTGLVRVSTGTVKDLSSLLPSDIPAPYPGTIPIAAVRTYSGQTGVVETKTWNDLADLRWGMFTPATGSSGAGGHIIQDEGNSLTARSKLNFVGSEVAVTDDAGNDATVVTINRGFYIDQSGGAGDTYGTLQGTVNGSNVLFRVSQGLYTTGTLRVYKNGQLQIQGSSEDWIETNVASGTFTFNTAPLTNDELTAEYGTTLLGSVSHRTQSEICFLGHPSSGVVSDVSATWAWSGNALTASTRKFFADLLTNSVLLKAQLAVVWTPNGGGSGPTAGVRIVKMDDGPANIVELTAIESNSATPINSSVDLTTEIQAILTAGVYKQLGYQTHGTGSNACTVYGVNIVFVWG